VSLSTLLLITGFLFFTAVALTALILAARNADDGYEDEAGYHPGRRKTARVRAPRAIKPVLSEQFKIMLMPDVPVRSLILAPGASPKPPRMNPSLVQVDLPAARSQLVPANLKLSELNLQRAPDEAGEPKRKRKSARKDAASDGNQLGFPGFAS
jgi:hypothetical protein